MSLKLFHAFFIACSSLLAFVITGWCFALGGKATLFGVLALVAGSGIAVYGFWFWRKVRTPEEERRRRRKLLSTAATMALAVLVGAPRTAAACSVCYGAAEGGMVDAARLGVWLLFGLIFVVQAAFAAFFLFLRRRSRQLNGGVAPWWTEMKESVES